MNHPSRFRLFPYTADAIKLLNDNGWLAILVTNQAGVARGYFSEDVIVQVHDRLRSDLENASARLDAIYYCAHHPSVGEPPYRFDCDCRKPKPRKSFPRKLKMLDGLLWHSKIAESNTDIRLTSRHVSFGTGFLENSFCSFGVDY